MLTRMNRFRDLHSKDCNCHGESISDRSEMIPRVLLHDSVVLR